MKRARVIRPTPIVLGDSAMVPPPNVIDPPPNKFTHEVRTSQPYYYTGANNAGQADGEFASGTQVVLMVHDGGRYCRVVDGQGLYVETDYAGLDPAVAEKD